MRLLNHIQIKTFVKKEKLKLGRDVLQSLEKKLEFVLQESTKRARQNHRKTLLGRDI